MKNNITELVFILDRSGSMCGLEKDTIGGFNSVLKEHKNAEGKAFVSTVLFDHEIKTVHDRIPIEEVAPMTEKDYQTRGTTALIDAIGTTVEHVDFIHKYIRPEDVPEKTMFVIITDGFENASRRFTSDSVKKSVEEHKKKGWEFVFVGANIDAVETASHFGISEDCAVNYHADKTGTEKVYDAVAKATFAFRQKNFDREAMPAMFSDVCEDFENRKKR
ncbi:MAG: hypothetical protein IJ283_08045 [Oscillospiraceae bacterium]|nr:hypothetical protein [Oscillospiraceae bacterium]